MKERIQHLVDIYVNSLLSISNDAGHHAPSQIEILASACNKKRNEFQRKQLTVRTTASDERQFNDRPDDKMINEMSFLRKPHHKIEFVKWLINQLKEPQLLALIAETKQRKIYKRKFTDQEIADYIEMTKDSYKYNKKMALIKVTELLVLIDQYEEAKSA